MSYIGTTSDKTPKHRPSHTAKAKKKRQRRKKKKIQNRVELNTRDDIVINAESGDDTRPVSLFNQAIYDWRQPGEAMHFWIVSMAVFIIYMITVPHTVTLEDSGLFNMVCYHAGVGHPPGYPLYTLLCVPFAHLPWVSPALGVNILSSLCGAFACGGIYRISNLMLHNRPCAYAAGISCGLSSVFWSQAVIQEVYSPNALLVIMTLWFTLLYFHSREPRHFYLLALVYALSLSNHWPLVGLSSFMFLLIILPAWRDILRLITGRGLFISGLAFVIGLLPYVYMIWRSRQNPYINFYDPLDNWDRVWHFLSRSGYSGVDEAGGTMFDKIQYAKWVGKQMMTEYHWVATGLMGLGFVWQWFRLRWNFTLGVIAGIVGSSFLLTFLLGFKYDELWRSVFRVYPVVPYALLSIYIAIGIDALAQFIKRFQKTFAMVVAIVISAAAIGATGYANFQENNRTDDDWGWKYGAAILESLEPNAILITWGDLHLPIMYAGTVEKVRPDVDIYNGQALIFNNRVTPALTPRDRKNSGLRKLIANTDRPVYFFENMGDIPWGYEEYGLVKKIRKDLKAKEIVYTLKPEILELIPYATDVSEADAWTRRHKQSITKLLTHLLVRTRLQSKEAQEAWVMLSDTYAGLIAIAYTALAYKDIDIDFQQLIAIFERARKKIDGVNLPDHEEANYYDLFGTALSQKPTKENLDRALEMYKKAIEVYPSPDNSALQHLMQIYVQLDNRAGFRELDEEYPNVAGRDKSLQKLLKERLWSWERQRDFTRG